MAHILVVFYFLFLLAVSSVGGHGDAKSIDSLPTPEYHVEGQDLVETVYDPNGTVHIQFHHIRTGSFKAHSTAGVGMILFGLWWMINMYSSWYRDRAEHIQFKSRISYGCLCGTTRMKTIPWEGFYKIFMSLVMCAVELSGTPTALMGLVATYLHLTLYLSFGFAGIFDVLVYFKCDIPPFMDNISMSFVFVVEALLFAFHEHPGDPVGDIGHTFLTYVCILTAITILVEIKYPNSFMLSLSRAYFALLQGTWLWVIAYNLIDRDTTNADPNNVHFMVVYFIWHIAADMVVTVFVGGAVKIVFVRIYGPIRKRSDRGGDYSVIPILNGKDDELDHD